MSKTLKRTSKPQFYYHVTNQNWEEKVILFPRDSGENRGWFEPDVSRICVGPDIVRCFIAIPYSKQTNYTYRTYRKTYAYYPYDVCDSIITGEKWLTDPTTFVKIGEIPKNIMKDFPRPFTTHVEIEIQRENLIIIRRLLAKFVKDRELLILKYCL